MSHPVKEVRTVFLSNHSYYAQCTTVNCKQILETILYVLCNSVHILTFLFTVRGSRCSAHELSPDPLNKMTRLSSSETGNLI